MPAAANTYDVVLRPFRELVKLGELATANAADDAGHENAAALRASAKTLSNEGARALKKLTPMLLTPSPDFGEFLLGLALRHEDTAPRFKDVDVLLYDFEDYIETDTFEKAQFDTLQAAVKDLAIVLLDKIRTRTAEATLEERPPAAAFPPLPPIPNAPLPPPKSPGQLRRPISRHRMTPAALPMHDAPRSEPQRRTSQPSETTHARSAYPISPAVTPIQRPGGMERAASYADGTQLPPMHTQGLYRPVTATSLPVGMSQLDIRTSMVSNNSIFPISPDSPQSQTFSASQYRSSVCTSVPETDYPNADEYESPGVVKTIDAIAYNPYEYGQEPPAAVHSSNGYHKPRPEVVLRARDDAVRINGNSGKRATIIDEIPTDGSSDTTSTGYPTAVNSANTRSRTGSVATNTHTHRSGSKPEDGANRTSVRSGSSSNHSRGSGTAFGPESSFGVLKGFCRGAQKFIADGPGGAVKKVGGRTQNEGPTMNKQDYAPDLLFSQMYSQQVGYQDEMAQCSHCEFKEIYSQLLQDMKQDPLANQQSHGLRYRSRFLYKSHVLTRDVHTTYFACLFCVHSGAPPRDGDATVFQSSSLLFRHLTRHQLPLPPVPGVTVLYDGVDPNATGAQDYDLHFPQPELSNTLDEEPDNDVYETDVLRPSARAIRDHIHRRGERPLDRPPILSARGGGGTDKEDVLQFLAGARILHVEFPEKGDGKWCTGWHDGVFGAFPSKMVELEAPRTLDAGSLPRSARSAVTKWKHEPRGSSSTPWLKFGKGEKITSIAWDDPRAWYWSGTTSKGKSGIFPKSHIRIETVKDGSQEEPPVLKKKSTQKSGLGGLFSRS